MPCFICVELMRLVIPDSATLIRLSRFRACREPCAHHPKNHWFLLSVVFISSYFSIYSFFAIHTIEMSRVLSARISVAPANREMLEWSSLKSWNETTKMPPRAALPPARSCQPVHLYKQKLSELSMPTKCETTLLRFESIIRLAKVAA